MISLLGKYLEKTTIQKDTFTPMFTVVLFTIAKTWKELTCPLKEEWIRTWYKHTDEDACTNWNFTQS